MKSEEGELAPGNLRSPPSNCSVPADSFAVYAGDSVAWTSKLPMVVFALAGVDLLVIDKDSNGKILVSAKIFDDNRDIIADIQRNHFLAIRPAASHWKRPEPAESRFAVYDHLDDDVFDLTLVNDHALRFTGTIRSPDGTKAISITNDKIIGAGTAMHSCFTNNNPAFPL